MTANTLARTWLFKAGLTGIRPSWWNAPTSHSSGGSPDFFQLRTRTLRLTATGTILSLA
jgi:hypothetical protein